MTASITGETWGEIIEPVREYLLRESTQPIAVLRPKLEAAHAELLGALDGVTLAQAQLRPSEGEGEDAWAIADVLRHVASSEALMTQRVRLLGTGESTHRRFGELNCRGWIALQTLHVPDHARQVGQLKRLSGVAGAGRRAQ